MVLVTSNSLNAYFDKQLEPLDNSELLKAYVVGTLSKYEQATFDYSKSSLTLVFRHAKSKMDFIAFQNLGDWVLTCTIMFPEHLHDASQEYYSSLAQHSYDYCYKLINKKLDVYAIIADEFIPLTQQARTLIQRRETYEHRF